MRFRIMLFFCAFFAVGLVVLSRAYQLQLLQADKLSHLADKQHQRTLTLQPSRGIIYDYKGHEMAISILMDSIFAEPQHLDFHSEKFRQLSRILKLEADLLRRKLYEGRHFVWLKRWASKLEAQQIEELKMRGIGFVKESRRFYPDNGLAAHMIGFAGMDARGLEGLELQYDDFLRDKPVRLTVDRDARGRILMSHEGLKNSAKPSTCLYLTIDKNLQYLAEKELALAVEKSRAKSGFILAANPRTMAIMAMANYPSFNPNRFWEFNASQWRNRAVTDLMEPGSLFKVFLVASALDAGVLNVNNSFYCEKGKYDFYGQTIHDIKPYGWLSVGEIVKYSSNIGAAKVGLQLGKARFYEYLRNFGFANTTNIDLPGEREGVLRPPGKWSRVEEGTVPFGQGISVTGIQILTALCALANDGVLMRPFVVSRVVDRNGNVLKENRPAEVRRVISQKSAAQMTALMRDVVSDDGTGRLAAIAGYPAAGKTGTAQKVDPITKAYSDDKVIVGFAGFAPASDPRLGLLVIIDEPEGRAFGGTAAAPVFHHVMKAGLQYMGVRQEPEVHLAAGFATPLGPPQARENVLIEKKEDSAAHQGSNSIMPDLAGKDMRAVLRWAQQAKINIQVKGSGWAVAQEPRPGDRLEHGQACRVTFLQVTKDE